MSWRLFAQTFGLIFLAELGDKTQLATLALSSSAQSRLTVFFAAASALVLASAIGVLAGELVSRAIPPIWVTRFAGAGFVMMGVLLLLARPE